MLLTTKKVKKTNLLNSANLFINNSIAAKKDNRLVSQIQLGLLMALSVFIKACGGGKGGNIVAAKTVQKETLSKNDNSIKRVGSSLEHKELLDEQSVIYTQEEIEVIELKEQTRGEFLADEAEASSLAGLGLEVPAKEVTLGASSFAGLGLEVGAKEVTVVKSLEDSSFAELKSGGGTRVEKVETEEGHSEEGAEASSDLLPIVAKVQVGAKEVTLGASSFAGLKEIEEEHSEEVADDSLASVAKVQVGAKEVTLEASSLEDLGLEVGAKEAEIRLKISTTETKIEKLKEHKHGKKNTSKIGDAEKELEALKNELVEIRAKKSSSQELEVEAAPSETVEQPQTEDKYGELAGAIKGDGNDDV
jgi:hypothetical protein